MVKINKQINIFKIFFPVYITCSVVYIPYANPSDHITPTVNQEQKKDNKNLQNYIYPQLNQGYSKELDQNLTQKTDNDDIENQDGTPLKPRANNNIGFNRIEKIDNKTLLKLACLCAVLPTTIFAVGVVVTTYLVTQSFK
jgi:hypothetical protein